MIKTNFSNFLTPFKLKFMTLLLGSYLCASAYGAIVSSHQPSYHFKDRRTHFSLVNPLTDSLLQHANLAIADLYAPFLQPIPTETSLSSITGQYNSSYSPLLFVNPKDSQNLFIIYNQDGFSDSSGTYPFISNANAQLAISRNGGKSWSYTIPALTTWQGGTLGQIIKANIQYPLSFSKKGILFFGGYFDQTVPLPPINGAIGGMFVSRSFDQGQTWSNPVIVDIADSSAINTFTAGVIDDSTGSILADPHHSRLVHLAWAKVVLPDYLYGNIWYSQSTDKGKKWETPRLIYEMVNDPVWVQQHGWVNNEADPAIPLGGQSIGGTLVSVPGKRGQPNVLLAGFNRFYPQQGAATYTQNVSDSYADHAVIRSLDNGKTWNSIASEVGLYVFSDSHNPTTSVDSLSITVADGGLHNLMEVSPKTNRVYFAWQGGNTAVSADPEVNQFYPTIQLAVSDDQGLTWSPPVNVSHTPFNSTILGANQSFNTNLAINEQGLVGITYTDFRHYEGSTGPNAFAAADNWLAIYREVKDPNGGSTGIGLDFVSEVRLTPQSFDAGISYNSNIRGVGASTGLVASTHSFLTAFPVTNQGNLSPSTGPYGMTVDLNNRLNIFFEKVKFRLR